MPYGEILKRAWTVTWRYKALWALGIFAGVSGCQGGGSGNFGGGGSSSPGGGGGGQPSNLGALPQLTEGAIITTIVAVVAAIVVVGTVFAILGVAARGGLIWSVNEIEEGREGRLGASWRAGFSRFWPLLVIDILLALPVLIIVLGLVGVLLVTLIGSSGVVFADSMNRTAISATLASTFGALACAVPLLLIFSLVTDILRLMAHRYVMIGGRGPLDAIGSAWRALRASLGNHAVMYIISGVLNGLSSLVIVIPAVILGVGIGLAALGPAMMSGRDAFPTGPVLGALGGFVLVMIVLSFLYSAIWGTFSSAVWTLFFRRLTGMQPTAEASGAGTPSGGYTAATYPPASYPPAPPVAGYPPPPPPPPPPA